MSKDKKEMLDLSGRIIGVPLHILLMLIEMAGFDYELNNRSEIEEHTEKGDLN